MDYGRKSAKASSTVIIKSKLNLIINHNYKHDHFALGVYQLLLVNSFPRTLTGLRAAHLNQEVVVTGGTEDENGPNSRNEASIFSTCSCHMLLCRFSNMMRQKTPGQRLGQ